MTSTAPPISISTVRLLAALTAVLVSACTGLTPTTGNPAASTAASAPPPAAGAATGTSAGVLAGQPGPNGAAPAAPGAPATGAVPPVAAAPPPVQPYDQAVLAAAQTLLGNAPRPPADAAPRPPQALVIDPLIDGLTGAQSVATRAMGAQITALIRAKFPQFEVQPFSAANVARSPLVLVGTFTGVNAQRQTSGPREAFRICLALADLKTGKLVSKGLAFAQPAGVDSTPLAFFRNAPAFTDDPATQGYIRTCQGTKAGDAINPLYADRIWPPRGWPRPPTPTTPAATRRRWRSTAAPSARRAATSSGFTTACTWRTGSWATAARRRRRLAASSSTAWARSGWR